MTEFKLDKLNSILKDLNSFVVAFSGGDDSSFLLYSARSIRNLKVLAGYLEKIITDPGKELIV